MSVLRHDLAAFVRTVSPALRQRPMTPKRYSRAQERDLKRARSWNADRNIIGFGVGPKCTNNKPDYSRTSLVVFVVRKLARSRVRKERYIPKRVEAESVGRQFTTDVIELGTLPVLQQGHILKPGTNAAHFTLATGSVTAVLKRRTDTQQTPLLLSCCHVFLPPEANGVVVESPPDPSAITFSHHVADVIDQEPLQDGGNVANSLDAALALPIAGAPPVSNEVPGFGQITSISSLQSGEFIPNGIRSVFGVGATSGHVSGEILAENVSTRMRDAAGRLFLFTGLVAYRPTPTTEEGDSGMPILMNAANSLELLGMHIGRGRTLRTNLGAAFFIPISRVVDRFQLELP